MSVLSRAQLAAKWITGFTPGNADYADFFDSFFHKTDTIPSDVIVIDTIANLPSPGQPNKIYLVEDTDGSDTWGIRVFHENFYQDPVGVAASGYTTAEQVRDALVTLIGTDRLPASAIRDLPTVLTNAQIEAAYNAEVAEVSQAEAEAGTLTDVRRWTPERIKQAIEALAANTSAGGSPTRTTASNVTGIVANISYWGSSTPTIAGASGNYTITCPAGVVLNSVTLICATSSQVTSANQFAITIDSADNVDYFSTAQATAVDNNGKKLVDLQAVGIEHLETSANTGSVTNTFVEIGAQTSSFRITFTF